MKLAIAKHQLKWKLAEIAKHSIFREWLLVASMPHKVWLDERLRRLVSKSKVPL